LRAKRLRVDLDVADVTLPADFDKLRIILDNLLSNAIKFSPFGGVIHVAARAAGEWAEFEVADEGPGIAPEDRGHVFDPFYQGRRTAEGLIGGTGIGLSVVREYAAAHGGDAEVVDDPSRRGARLRVRLPLAQSGSAA
jgi:two-component system sensor histidine kinase GlrK